MYIELIILALLGLSCWAGGASIAKGGWSLALAVACPLWAWLLMLDLLAGTSGAGGWLQRYRQESILEMDLVG